LQWSGKEGSGKPKIGACFSTDIFVYSMIREVYHELGDPAETHEIKENVNQRENSNGTAGKKGIHLTAL
jgi:hypothetical protein